MLENFLFDEKVIERWKQKGRKVIGCVSSDVVEEIIYAADILPIRLFGKTERLEKAHKYMPVWCCSYSRRCVEAALDGQFKAVDGIVGSKFDDTCIHLFELLKQVVKPKFTYFLETPIVKTDSNKRFFIKNLLEFKRKLENFAERTVSERDLKASIKIYNENRRLLKRLYETRKAENPPLKGSEILEIVISSMTLPKEAHNEKMMELLRTLPSKEGEEFRDKVRIHVSGTEVYDVEILRAIEECDANIVSDDLDTGSRYFWVEVEEAKDPYEALAERYLFNKVTNLQVVGQFSNSIEERAMYIRSLVEEFKSDGVIFLVDRGCEVFGYAYPHLRRELENFGIPCIHLDLEASFSREHYIARVKAFVEALKERRLHA